MRPVSRVRTAITAPFQSLGTLPNPYRGIIRVSLAALSFVIIIAFSQNNPVTRAGANVAPSMRPVSLLPQNVGIGVPTDDAITITFDAAMNPGTVEAALNVVPAQPVELTWSEELDEVTVTPERHWRTDETYTVVVGEAASRTNGQPLTAPRRYSFTTQTAPTVADFQVRFADVPPAEAPAATAAATQPGGAAALPTTRTAKDVSATSAITLSFSDAMDRADVEGRFAISPEVKGTLSWKDDNLVFAPGERLEPGARYTVSVIGAHDRDGNVLGGKGNFSFLVQPGAQVTKTVPESNAIDVEPAIVEIWFSQPMNVDATNKAFALVDTATGMPVGGFLNWNDEKTQLTYSPDYPFVGGTTFTVSFAGGARDVDGNAVEASLSFTTKASAPAVAAAPATRGAATTRAAPVVPPTAPATSLAGYALNQVNAARAAYGFAPLTLDASISAVAAAHAMDQAANGYFSHTGLNGSTKDSRLRAGGVSFSIAGENQCYLEGRSEQATLDWCHAQFMAEPYPGHWNHIGNILDPRFHRMGVGIAIVGARTVIVWDFTD